MDYEQLGQRFRDLASEIDHAQLSNTRTGYLAVVEKAKEALTVADLIGSAGGAKCRAHADLVLAEGLYRLGNMAAAARAACSSLRAARAAGDRTSLVKAVAMCGTLAQKAPGEMAKAEKESREQERLGGSPSYGGFDLSQEGRISLPTIPAALFRLGLTYNKAAVAICDAALAVVGGRGSPADDDERRVPSLRMEADARSSLGFLLHELGVEPQRSSEMLRQAVALLRRAVRTAEPGFAALQAKLSLAGLLSNLGAVFAGMAEGEKCLREALELSEETDDVALKQHVLLNLCNMSGRPDLPVGPRGRGAPLAAERALCSGWKEP